MSTSIRLKLVGTWLAVIDCVTNIDDLDHSGFSFDTIQMKFETLDSRKKINMLDGRQCKEKRTMLTSKQNYVPDLLLFRYQERTQQRAMSIALNIEVHNDNLKQFNQVWEEMLLSEKLTKRCGKHERETTQELFVHEKLFDFISCGHASGKKKRNRTVSDDCWQLQMTSSSIKDTIR